MFCKKCGSNIKDDAAFCPKCGEKTGKMKPQTASPVLTEMPMSFGQPMMQQTQNVEQKQKKDFKLSEDQKKIALTVGIVIAVIAVIAGIIALIIGLTSKKNTIVGEWKSQDMVDLADAISGLLEAQGFSGWEAELVSGALGMAADKVTLTFTESGNMRIKIGSVSPSIGKFTYEDLGDEIIINFECDATVFGFGIPINFSYTAKYDVDGDTMTLDLFGYRTKFKRVEDDD